MAHGLFRLGPVRADADIHQLRQAGGGEHVAHGGLHALAQDTGHLGGVLCRTFTEDLVVDAVDEVGVERLQRLA